MRTLVCFGFNGGWRRSAQFIGDGECIMLGLFFLLFPARCDRTGEAFGFTQCLFSWGLSVARLIVDYFEKGRGAVKGKRNDLVGEGVQMCVGIVVGVVGMGAVVWWFVSIRITLRGWFLLNVAETRGFCSTGFFSGSRSSAEPVVFSRATHIRDHHFKQRDGVKSKMIIVGDKNSTETATLISEKSTINEIVAP
ncbi:hypothetical protein [uncultured Gimesia sp.]|uniref:hypothetical protein n=1 Tax=uncultured Gimesia sp. TaxID=1678688 RepID=UPI0030D91E27|tara:strand:- start:2037 stop:2618 length:582 start_codon:yes stop_codon:yes gene_type:complete